MNQDYQKEQQYIRAKKKVKQIKDFILIYPSTLLSIYALVESSSMVCRTKMTIVLYQQSVILGCTPRGYFGELAFSFIGLGLRI